MNDREKMIEIIKQASKQAYADFHELFCEGVKRVRDGEISRFTNRDVRPTHDEILADKLIEAGVGYIKDYKHRAEVAERALGFICDKAMKNHDIIVFPEDGTQTKNKAELFTYCIERAERELAEERKDD